jgi:hypothetical protein
MFFFLNQVDFQLIQATIFDSAGCTIAALVHFMHKVTQMLDSGTNSYVRCSMIGFSKAFDTVDHVIIYLLSLLILLHLLLSLIGYVHI